MAEFTPNNQSSKENKVCTHTIASYIGLENLMLVDIKQFFFETEKE